MQLFPKNSNLGLQVSYVPFDTHHVRSWDPFNRVLLESLYAFQSTYHKKSTILWKICCMQFEEKEWKDKVHMRT